MSHVQLTPVRSSSEMNKFIDLPWAIYDGNRNWVPPIKYSVKMLLDPLRHPFWKFSERELFLAHRGTEVIGRIAAIIDHNYNGYHKEKMCAWGFFECLHDPEAAVALFSAVEKWADDHNSEFLRGPVNPSTNYEVGLLLEGFDSPPALMMPYNHPYYLELVHFCGFRKEKDLFSFRYDRGDPLPDWAFTLSDRISKKNEITIRTADVKDIKNQLILMNQVYADCWGQNWGFVPMTDDELKASSRELRLVLDRDLAFFTYKGDEPVGVFLALPDINPFLKRLNGKIGPTALLKRLFFWSEVCGIRILLFGVKDRYRQMGVPLVVFDHLMKVFRRKNRYQYIEAGWTLEDNQAVNGFFQEGGMKPHKRYRIFRKDLLR